MRVLAAGALTGLALLSLTLLAGELGPPARFTDPIVAHARDSASSDAVFASSTPRLYAAADLVNVPAGARVGVRWISLGPDPAAEGTVLSTDEMVLDSPLARASFILGRPAGGWATGAYRVEMLLDERVQSSLGFLVR